MILVRVIAMSIEIRRVIHRFKFKSFFSICFEKHYTRIVKQSLNHISKELAFFCEKTTA